MLAYSEENRISWEELFIHPLFTKKNLSIKGKIKIIQPQLPVEVI